MAQGDKRPEFRGAFEESSMKTSTVERYADPEVEAAVARIEAIASLMDDRFVIPGTSTRVGLDAVIGLVPVVGDLISLSLIHI